MLRFVAHGAQARASHHLNKFKRIHEKLKLISNQNIIQQKQLWATDGIAAVKELIVGIQQRQVFVEDTQFGADFYSDLNFFVEIEIEIPF